MNNDERLIQHTRTLWKYNSLRNGEFMDDDEKDLMTEIDQLLKTYEEPSAAPEYQIMDQQLFNSGGHIMVQICEVYLPDENKTVWAYTDGETASIVSTNYLTYGLDDEFYNYDHMTLFTIDAEYVGMADQGPRWDTILKDCLQLYDQNNK